MEKFLIVSIFLNIITFIVVVTAWIYSSNFIETNEEETEIPVKGRIVIKNDGRIMYSIAYEDTKDFDRAYAEVFAQLLQIRKKDEDWVIEVIPL